MTKIKTFKQDAIDAGLELYYDTQWQSWGLIDPDCRVEGLWLSPNRLKEMSYEDFRTHYINHMVERVKEAA